eukprot:148077-Prorocentrum_minimum.AAC.1
MRSHRLFFCQWYWHWAADLDLTTWTTASHGMPSITCGPGGQEGVRRGFRRGSGGGQEGVRRGSGGGQVGEGRTARRSLRSVLAPFKLLVTASNRSFSSSSDQGPASPNNDCDECVTPKCLSGSAL